MPDKPKYLFLPGDNPYGIKAGHFTDNHKKSSPLEFIQIALQVYRHCISISAKIIILRFNSPKIISDEGRIVQDICKPANGT
jgi:hypothetical protein